MQIKIENLKENPTNILRRAGYSFQKNVGNEMSFIRSLALSGYPRFHIYARVENSFTLIISIHLDQKKETYGDNTRHHGEYQDEGALRTEVERILPILNSI
ncbi:MAG: hypothetical protein V3574_04515 [Candidatus Moraniibacteriota bacterium]